MLWIRQWYSYCLHIKPALQMQVTVFMPIKISKMCVARLLGYLFNVHAQCWQPNHIYDVRFHIWSRQWYMVINAGRLFRDVVSVFNVP